VLSTDNGIALTAVVYAEEGDSNGDANRQRVACTFYACIILINLSGKLSLLINKLLKKQLHECEN